MTAPLSPDRRTAHVARLEKANYAGPQSRQDRCATCRHAAVYERGRGDKLKCRAVGWYVQAGGICDQHARKPEGAAA